MKKLQFKRIGFLIGFTLLVSIAVQAWRNYTQFQVIQEQLTGDIQQSLDNALENYYAELAKTDIITYTDTHPLRDSSQTLGKIARMTLAPMDTFPGQPPPAEKNKMLIKTLSNSLKKTTEALVWNGEVSKEQPHLILLDSAMTVGKRRNMRFSMSTLSSDTASQLDMFTSKIIISFSRDTLDFDLINGFLFSELKRRRIDINYRLVHLTGDAGEDSLLNQGKKPMPFKTVARSTFLPPGQSLEMYFENTALTILKRGAVEILTSFLFLAIIAYAFYYLYQTIKNQKEIAEIKQDLIANITHEFKTPIATTLSAIEGIEMFNPDNDAEKTKRYLGISKSQMHKLNQMVEKLLETATLDSEQMVLKKELLEPEPLLHQLVQKFRTLAPEKSIELVLPAHSKALEVDPFHFENALSNLLDNAVKYGGSEIRICLDQNGLHKIRVHDNGGTITSGQKERVFEQFYRIPKGDLHDVKGFGIGLYYVKKILEKHGGKIELETGQHSTTFITYWP